MPSFLNRKSSNRFVDAGGGWIESHVGHVGDWRAERSVEQDQHGGSADSDDVE